jgi:hypothetical protein
LDNHNIFWHLIDKYLAPSKTKSSRADYEIVPHEDRTPFDYGHSNSLDLSDALFNRAIVFVGGQPAALLLAFGIVVAPLAFISGPQGALLSIVFAGSFLLKTP